MLDLKKIREDPKAVEWGLQSKDPSLSLAPTLELDRQIRESKQTVEKLKQKRREYAKEVGRLKREGEPVEKLLAKGEEVGGQIDTLDCKLRELERALRKELELFPNLPSEETPLSLDPKENICLEMGGKKPTFSFTPKNHLELNQSLKLFDFKRGAKVAGAGWPLYRGLGAQLEWALINFMLSYHLSQGFEQWIPPLIGLEPILHGSAHLPKFEHQLYKIEGESSPLYLIPTSEAILNGIHFEEILDEKALPLRYVAYTPCFRREAGAAGACERGLIRTHQFNKVEMFCLTHPSKSEEMFDQMVTQAEALLTALGLHYRKMLLVSGDMSFAAAKTVDLEVWLPGQSCYYEVSSISNCTDFQARRSKIRCKREGEKPLFVHTLNGSGLATSRLLVALVESNQLEDGRVLIPLPLRSFMGGREWIHPS